MGLLIVTHAFTPKGTEMKSNWMKANDDSRAPQYRAKYVEAHGGEWVKSAKGWNWEGSVKPVKVAKPRLQKILKDPEPILREPEKRKKRFWNDFS